MKKLYYAAILYAVLGLASGLFYRIYTHSRGFEGSTELAVMHTHLLALGLLVMLIVLSLEKLFTLSATKWFNLFFWHYNAGLLLTVSLMLIIGLGQVTGQDSSSMLAGIAGLGHIIITAGIAFLLVAIGKRLKA